MKTLLVFVITFMTYLAQAASAVSSAYDLTAEKLASLATQTDCNSLQKIHENRANAENFAADNLKVCKDEKTKAALSIAPLKAVSDNIVYSNLCTYETQNLNCSINRWNDITSPANTDKRAEIVKIFNEEIPKLDAIKEEISRYSMLNTNPGLKYKNDKSLSHERRIQLIREAEEDVGRTLMFMQDQYDQIMASIPYTNHSPVKSFIESKLSGPFSKLKTVSADEFQVFALDARSQFADEKNELEKSKKENNFSSKQEEKLVINPQNIAQLMLQQPDLANSAFVLQCRIDQRQKGKMAINVGLTVASTLMTGGAYAYVTASRLALAARNVEVALSTAQTAKTLSTLGLLAGGAETVSALYSKCTKNIPPSTASCQVDLEKIKSDRRISTCLQSISLAALPYSSWAVKKMADRESFVAKAYQKFTSRTPSATSVTVPISPGTFKTNSITIEARTLDGKEPIRIHAEILSTKTAADGSKIYRVQSSHPLTNIRIEANMTEAQLRGLNPIDRPISTTDGYAVSELVLSEAEMKKLFGSVPAKPKQAPDVEAIEFKPVPGADQLKIVKPIDPPRPVAPTATSSEGVYIPELGTNTTKIQIINQMDSREKAKFEVVGEVIIDNIKKYEVRIHDSTHVEPITKYLSKEEILKMVPPSARAKPK